MGIQSGVRDAAALFAPVPVRDVPRLQRAAVIYLTLIMAAVCINFPGQAYWDTLVMIYQSRVPGGLTDWHAPIATRAWSVLDPLLGQPASALVVNCVLIFSWAAIALSRQELWTHPRGLAAIAMAVATTPFAICLAGYVIKDMFLVGVLMLGFALLETSSREGRCVLSSTKFCALVIVVALFLLVRSSNFLVLVAAAVLFLVVTLPPRRRLYPVLLFMLAVSLAALPLNRLVNNGLLGAQDSHVENSGFVFDVAGISVHSSRNLFEKLPDWPKDLPKLEPCYSPIGVDPYFWGACRGYGQAVKSIAETSGKATVAAWWLSSIATHPGAYLSHRLAVAREVLNHAAGGGTTWEDIIIMRPPGYATVHNAAHFIASTEQLGTNIQIWEPTAVYRGLGVLASLWDAAFGFPVLWVLACTAAAGVLLTLRLSGRMIDEIAAAAACLGIANAVITVMVAPAGPRRYMLLTLACMMVALFRLLLLPRRPCDTKLASATADEKQK
jgi:hypothetical protein